MNIDEWPYVNETGIRQGTSILSYLSALENAMEAIKQMEKASAIKLTKFINESATKKSDSQKEDDEKEIKEKEDIDKEEEKDVSSYNDYFAEESQQSVKKNMPFNEKALRSFYEDLINRRKRYKKSKIKYDRVNAEVTKCSLQLKLFQNKMTQQPANIKVQKSKLDIGIINGALAKQQIQELQNSFGHNKLYYKVFKEKDCFESEKISQNLQAPHWKETFTFTLNREDEVITFEIYRSNSSEGEQLMDQFLVKVEELLLKFIDQKSHQMQPLTAQKQIYSPCFTEKENVFEVAMRWRHDDSAAKVQQLKKKIQKMKEMLQKQEQGVLQAKEEFEKMLNFKGNGKELLHAWGIEKQIREGNFQNSSSSQKKKRAIGKLSKSGSRNSSFNADSQSDYSKSQIADEYQLNQKVNLTRISQPSSHYPYHVPYGDQITPKSLGGIGSQKFGRANIKINDQDSQTMSKGSFVDSPKSSFLQQQSDLQISKESKVKIKVKNSQLKNRDSPNSVQNFNRNQGSPLTGQQDQRNPLEKAGSGFISHFKKNSQVQKSQEKQQQLNIKVEQNSNSNQESENQSHSSLALGSENISTDSPMKIQKLESHKVKEKKSGRDLYQNVKKAPQSQQLSSQILSNLHRDNQSSIKEHFEQISDVNLDDFISPKSVPFKQQQIISQKQSIFLQKSINDGKPLQNIEEEENKQPNTKTFKVKMKKFHQQMRAKEENLKLTVESLEKKMSTEQDKVGEVEFKETRKDKMNKTHNVFSQQAFKIEQKHSDKNLSFRHDIPRIELTITSARNQLNATHCQESTPKLFTEMPTNQQNSHNEDKYKEWYNQINKVMTEANEQKNYQLQEKQKCHQQRQSEQMLSPQSSDYLGSQVMRQTPRKITDTSLLINNSMKDRNDFLRGSVSHGQFSVNNDQTVISGDKEILLPTQENLKRIELKNQRRDLTNSLASSTINQMILKNPGKSKSTFGGSVQENPLYPKPAFKSKLFLNSPNLRFGMGPTTMAMHFNQRMSFQRSFGPIQAFQGPQQTQGNDYQAQSPINFSQLTGNEAGRETEKIMNTSQFSGNSGGVGIFFRHLGGINSMTSLHNDKNIDKSKQ